MVEGFLEPATFRDGVRVCIDLSFFRLVIIIISIIIITLTVILVSVVNHNTVALDRWRGSRWRVTVYCQ